VQSFSGVSPLAKVFLANCKQPTKRKCYSLDFASRPHGTAKGKFQDISPRSSLMPLSMTPIDLLDPRNLPVETISIAPASLLSDLNIQGDEETFALSPQMVVIVFIIGVIPFIIATFEFWRRIAVGASFGTGSDSVVFPMTNVTIGMDGVSPLSSRGKQILGTDSLITAYLIFATVGVVLGIVFYSILTSPIPN
jgi:hypothetical protein